MAGSASRSELSRRAARLSAFVGLLALSACGTTIDGRGEAPDGSAEDPAGNRGVDDGTAVEDDGVQTPAAGADYDALFEAPTNPETTPNSARGIWAGSEYPSSQYDVRLKLTAKSIIVATRLSGGGETVGVEVPAIVTATSIRVLASKASKSGSIYNRISFVPVTVRICGASEAFGAACARLEETELSLSMVHLFSLDGRVADGTYIKLSD